jgi:copper homeostasis protein
MKKIILEICVDSIESAIIAEKSGADRIELCSSLNDGGLTPSYGMIKTVVEIIEIPVNVLIRPNGGSFNYSEKEFEIMLHDIALVKSFGASGVVFGILKKNNTIDFEKTEKLVEFAKPLSITFHRAFDFIPNPSEALEKIINLKVDRILTSGQKLNAEQGIPLIKKLVDQSKGKIIVMPGGGVNEENIRKIVIETGVLEIHSSARIKTKVKNADGIISENKIAGSDRIKKMISELQF